MLGRRGLGCWDREVWDVGTHRSGMMGHRGLGCWDTGLG